MAIGEVDLFGFAIFFRLIQRVYANPILSHHIQLLRVLEAAAPRASKQIPVPPRCHANVPSQQRFAWEAESHL